MDDENPEDFQFDVGPHIEDLGFWWLFLKYGLPILGALILCAVVGWFLLAFLSLFA